MLSVDLVPILFRPRPATLDELAAAVERTVGATVRHRPAWFDAENAYDSGRGQYNSTSLLAMLLGDAGQAADRILGVTSVDLFVPILTYVFGEAQLEGRAAVVSIHRLRPEAYGLPSDAGRLADRLSKEAVHELGHTFGLLHCTDPSCVMHASTYVEEIDLKRAFFCADCDSAVKARRPPSSPRSGAALP